LWLGFAGTSLKSVKVRQLFPVVILVLVRIVMVGAHNVIRYLGLRHLRLWGSGLVEKWERKCKTRGLSKAGQEEFAKKK